MRPPSPGQLSATRRHLRRTSTEHPSATGPAAYDPSTRINDGAAPAWTAGARSAPAFTLDACLDAPAHVPGWMLDQTTSSGPTIDPVPLPNHAGLVTTADATGHGRALAAHYRRILAAAPPPTRWRPDIARFCCFAVDLVIGLAEEPPLRIETFGAAALAATELLGRLADPASPDDVLYDNLDQCLALRMNITRRDVFTLEWDLERPLHEDTPRPLRFPRPLLAAQARRAWQRLQHVHLALVQGDRRRPVEPAATPGLTPRSVRRAARHPRHAARHPRHPTGHLRHRHRRVRRHRLLHGARHARADNNKLEHLK